MVYGTCADDFEKNYTEHVTVFSHSGLHSGHYASGHLIFIWTDRNLDWRRHQFCMYIFRKHIGQLERSRFLCGNSAIFDYDGRRKLYYADCHEFSG